MRSNFYVWFECGLLRVAALGDSTAAATGDSSPMSQLNGNANSNANSNDNSLNNQDTSPKNATLPAKRVEELYDIPVGEYIKKKKQNSQIIFLSPSVRQMMCICTSVHLLSAFLNI